MDAKDLTSSLAYSLKYEVTRTVYKTSRHIRSFKMEDHMSRERDDKFEFFFNRLEKLLNVSVAGKKNSSAKLKRDLLEVQQEGASSQKGVLVAATLADLEREAIPHRVLNLNNKPKILDKEAVIATCEPVVDIVARPQEFSGAEHLLSTLENLEILNEEQRTIVRKLLEFQSLFLTCDADISHCNMTQHRIYTGDHPPIKQYPRHLPLARKEEADHLVKEMVDNRIIEESSGPWASPIVLSKKKDGST
ncbi:hypothetical protein AVEN_213187-1 [Araneus ventricosus]|uniref:Peptidase A9 domain-containing protein n=1 Tax=Araneus ventricosus TaxID=182803 RepID=A0A4Y2I526_ARAVE|nr:hypothetical protein AVEN_213187-1 [Araneus ventricosus]